MLSKALAVAKAHVKVAWRWYAVAGAGLVVGAWLV